MPIKSRYWKNPEKWRKEFTDRTQRLVKLGLSRAHQLSPAGQLSRQYYNTKYRRTHLKENNIACKKYRAKIIAAVGSCGRFGLWKYKVLKDETKQTPTSLLLR